VANISDVIESFILSTMGSSNNINLSRNELADYFNCAPSQINYVLTTRFNINRGFIIQSQRGGGGFIRLVKIQDYDNNYISRIIENNLNSGITEKNALYLIEDLVEKEFLTQEQAKILMYSVTDKSLSNPIKMEDMLRANIIKNVLINTLRKDN